jgi:hypothetical protein
MQVESLYWTFGLVAVALAAGSVPATGVGLYRLHLLRGRVLVALQALVPDPGGLADPDLYAGAVASEDWGTVERVLSVSELGGGHGRAMEDFLRLAYQTKAAEYRLGRAFVATGLTVMACLVLLPVCPLLARDRGMAVALVFWTLMGAAYCLVAYGSLVRSVTR